jgi:hypothetical protein
MAQVVVELTGDEAKLLRSMQKVIEQNSKVKDSFKNSAKESKTASDQINSHITKNIGSLASMAAGYVSVQAATNLVVDVHTRMVDKQEKALDLARQLAKAQQEAAKNLAGTDSARISDVLEKQVPEIAVRANFQDLPKITQALGSVASIIGEQSAASAVEVAAQLSRLTPDDLQSAATSTADVMKAAQMTDGREAMALLLTSGAVARPEELTKLAGGAAKAINAGVGAAPTQAPREAAKEAAALFAVLSQVDKQGDSSSTAAVQFIELLRKTFQPTRDEQAKRDDRIAELLKEQAITPDEQVVIDRATLTIQQKEIAARGVRPEDKSVQAQDIRIDLAEAKAGLERAKKSATLNDRDSKELARLQEQQKLATSDPGTMMKRLEAVQRSPELLRTAEAELQGEAAFKPIAQGFFDPTSIHMQTLSKSLASITTDVQKFDDAVASMTITPQQKVVLSQDRAATAVAVKRSTDTPEANIAAAAKIEQDALSATNRGFMETIASKLSGVTTNVQRSAASDDREFVDRRIDTLSGRLRGFQRDGEDEKSIQVLIQAIQALRDLPVSKPANNPDQKLMEDQNRILSQTQETQTNVVRLLEKQNELLGSAMNRAPTPPNPAAINAQTMVNK